MRISKKIKNIVALCFVCSISLSFIFADSSYVVKKGDTLYSISRKYEITVPELRAANNLSENDVLKVGDKLVIPNADIGTAAALSSSVKAQSASTSSDEKAPIGKTDVYQVQKGDTLYGIARKFQIKLPELLALNNIDTNTTLKAGQKIKVPALDDKNNKKDDKIASNSTNNKNISPANVSSVPTKTVASSASGIVWPLVNPSVKNISGKVSGVLLTGKDNENVTCVHEGTVMYTGVYRGFGEVVFVQAKTGLIYSYSGLDSVSVNKGDYIIAGKELGSVGKGNDACMKFMVFQNGMPVDPVKAPRG